MLLMALWVDEWREGEVDTVSNIGYRAIKGYVWGRKDKVSYTHSAKEPKLVGRSIVRVYHVSL